jgi:hypothetical protein
MTMRWGKKGQWVLFERFVIGPDENPYMIRWRLFECPWFRVFFHRILRDDSDRHMHDHPFSFVSMILRGGYWEWTPVVKKCTHGDAFGYVSIPERRWCRPFTILFRRATDLHRIALRDGRPAWTLVIAGSRQRQWGFHTEEGWVAHTEYFESW